MSDDRPSFGGNTTKRTELGALWKKTDRNGNDFFSAKIKIDGKEFNLNFFKNKLKNQPNQPDFRAFGD